MDNENILSKIYRAYQKAVPSPLAQSAILGGLTVPAIWLANKLMYNRLKRLAQDPRAAMLAGLTPQQAYEELQEFQNSTFNKRVFPWLGGATVFALSAAPHVNFDAPYWGLNKWYPTTGTAKQKSAQTPAVAAGDVDQNGVPQGFPSQEELQEAHMEANEGRTPGQNFRLGMQKSQTLKKLAMWGSQGYQPQFDFNTPLTQRTAVDLFANNPYIKDKDYERNLGTSIIMGAPVYGGQTTLGNVYDSAVSKFDKKLTLGGLAGSAIKGAVAGGLASMFTDTLGAVVGMPDPLRRSVANTVGFANAMCTILS